MEIYTLKDANNIPTILILGSVIVLFVLIGFGFYKLISYFSKDRSSAIISTVFYSAFAILIFTIFSLDVNSKITDISNNHEDKNSIVNNFNNFLDKENIDAHQFHVQHCDNSKDYDNFVLCDGKKKTVKIKDENDEKNTITIEYVDKGKDIQVNAHKEKIEDEIINAKK